MIPMQDVMKASVSAMAKLMSDNLHRQVQGGFNGTNITFKCRYSGDDLILKFKNIKGQIQTPILVPVQKKIIVP